MFHSVSFFGCSSSTVLTVLKETVQSHEGHLALPQDARADASQRCGQFKTGSEEGMVGATGIEPVTLRV
jgi:hypothetical protein